MIIPVRNGFRIKSHTSGKIYPKVYKTRKAARRRISQMLMFKSMRGGKK